MFVFNAIAIAFVPETPKRFPDKSSDSIVLFFARTSAKIFPPSLLIWFFERFKTLMLVFARGFSIQAAKTSKDRLQFMLDWVRSKIYSPLENKCTRLGQAGLALFQISEI